MMSLCCDVGQNKHVYSATTYIMTYVTTSMSNVSLCCDVGQNKHVYSATTYMMTYVTTSMSSVSLCCDVRYSPGCVRSEIHRHIGFNNAQYEAVSLIIVLLVVAVIVIIVTAVITVVKMTMGILLTDDCNSKII